MLVGFSNVHVKLLSKEKESVLGNLYRKQGLHLYGEKHTS